MSCLLHITLYTGILRLLSDRTTDIMVYTGNTGYQWYTTGILVIVRLIIDIVSDGVLDIY